jgi:hypothetical protein
MTTQTEAERLADALTKYLGGNTAIQAAAELRRLSVIEQAAKNLVKALRRYHNEQAFNKLKELVK